MSEPHPLIVQRQIAALQAAMRELREAQPVEGGGSGPHDPGMEARVAKLESDVGHIRSDLAEVRVDVRELRKAAERDFRMLFGAIIVVALGLAGIMAKGFHWF